MGKDVNIEYGNIEKKQLNHGLDRDWAGAVCVCVCEAHTL